MSSSPAEWVGELIELFPAFDKIWNDERALDGDQTSGGDQTSFTYHTIMLTFGPVSRQLLTDTSPKQIKQFCTLINTAVKQGGALESAVSTCFLEHASQLGIRKLIQAHLGPEAKRELR